MCFHAEQCVSNLHANQLHQPFIHPSNQPTDNIMLIISPIFDVRKDEDKVLTKKICKNRPNKQTSNSIRENEKKARRRPERRHEFAQHRVQVLNVWNSVWFAVDFQLNQGVVYCRFVVQWTDSRVLPFGFAKKTLDCSMRWLRAESCYVVMSKRFSEIIDARVWRKGRTRTRDQRKSFCVTTHFPFVWQSFLSQSPVLHIKNSSINEVLPKTSIRSIWIQRYTKKETN